MRDNTYRELKLWEMFWREELNNPDRHDMYLMRVCQTLAGGQLREYIIEFGQTQPVYKTREEAAAASKARWDERREAHLAREKQRCPRPS